MVRREESPLKKKQRAAAILRQRFLQSLLGLVGTKCTVLSYEQTTHEAEFRGWHIDDQMLLFRNFKTPSQVMPTVRIRTNDIVYVDFHK